MKATGALYGGSMLCSEGLREPPAFSLLKTLVSLYAVPSLRQVFGLYWQQYHWLQGTDWFTLSEFAGRYVGPFAALSSGAFVQPDDRLEAALAALGAEQLAERQHARTEASLYQLLQQTPCTAPIPASWPTAAGGSKRSPPKGLEDALLATALMQVSAGPRAERAFGMRPEFSYALVCYLALHQAKPDYADVRDEDVWRRFMAFTSAYGNTEAFSVRDDRGWIHSFDVVFNQFLSPVAVVDGLTLFDRVLAAVEASLALVRDGLYPVARREFLRVDAASVGVLREQLRRHRQLSWLVERPPSAAELQLFRAERAVDLGRIGQRLVAYMQSIILRSGAFSIDGSETTYPRYLAHILIDAQEYYNGVVRGGGGGAAAATLLPCEPLSVRFAWTTLTVAQLFLRATVPKPSLKKAEADMIKDRPTLDKLKSHKSGFYQVFRQERTYSEWSDAALQMLYTPNFPPAQVPSFTPYPAYASAYATLQQHTMPPVAILGRAARRVPAPAQSRPVVPSSPPKKAAKGAHKRTRSDAKTPERKTRAVAVFDEFSPPSGGGEGLTPDNVPDQPEGYDDDGNPVGDVRDPVPGAEPLSASDKAAGGVVVVHIDMDVDLPSSSSSSMFGFDLQTPPRCAWAHTNPYLPSVATWLHAVLALVEQGNPFALVPSATQLLALVDAIMRQLPSVMFEHELPGCDDEQQAPTWQQAIEVMRAQLLSTPADQGRAALLQFVHQCVDPVTALDAAGALESLTDLLRRQRALPDEHVVSNDLQLLLDRALPAQLTRAYGTTSPSRHEQLEHNCALERLRDATNLSSSSSSTSTAQIDLQRGVLCALVQMYVRLSRTPLASSVRGPPVPFATDNDVLLALWRALPNAVFCAARRLMLLWQQCVCSDADRAFTPDEAMRAMCRRVREMIAQRRPAAPTAPAPAPARPAAPKQRATRPPAPPPSSSQAVAPWGVNVLPQPTGPSSAAAAAAAPQPFAFSTSSSSSSSSSTSTPFTPSGSNEPSPMVYTVPLVDTRAASQRMLDAMMQRFPDQLARLGISQ